MPTSEVIFGSELYRHDETSEVMRVESASMEDNWVTLTDKDSFTRTGFVRVWRGTIDQFKAQWTRVSEINDRENFSLKMGT